jgi:hypothetical protein
MIFIKVFFFVAKIGEKIILFDLSYTKIPQTFIFEPHQW